MNNVFIGSTINEIEKLSGKKKVWMLPGLAVILTLLSLWGLARLKLGTGILPVTPEQFPILILGWFTSIILPLFIVMAGSDMFSGELTERTIKLSLLKPISRFKVYMSKLLALSAYIVGTLVLVFLLTTIGALFLGSGVNVLGTLAVYTAALIPMLLVAFAVGLISQFFKSGSGVMVFSILLLVGSQALAFVYPRLSDFMISSYLNWHTLFVGAGASGGRILTLFMFMVSYSIIMLTAGYYLFERKEL